jgi:hypothetical protein
MCHALADAGWLWRFDGFAAVSSGSPNLLWALAGGDLDAALSVYAQVAEGVALRRGRRVLELAPLRQFWVGRTAMLEQTLERLGERPLRFAALRASDPHAPVAHVEGFATASDVIDTAVEGCRIPLLAGAPDASDPEALFDGGFVHPCASALATEATHLVVLSTRPDHQLPRPPDRSKVATAAAMSMHGRAVARRWEGSQRSAAQRWAEWADTGLLDGRPTARISVHHALGHLCREPARLRAAAHTAYAATRFELAAC